APAFVRRGVSDQGSTIRYDHVTSARSAFFRQVDSKISISRRHVIRSGSGIALPGRADTAEHPSFFAKSKNADPVFHGAQFIDAAPPRSEGVIGSEALASGPRAWHGRPADSWRSLLPAPETRPPRRTSPDRPRSPGTA